MDQKYFMERQSNSLFHPRMLSPKSFHMFQNPYTIIDTGISNAVDLSGNGYELLQPTAGLQPAAGSNYVDFVNTGKVLTVPGTEGFLGTVAMTTYALITLHSTSAVHFILGCAQDMAGTWTQIDWGITTSVGKITCGFVNHASTTFVGDSADASPDIEYAVGISYDGVGARMYLDGTEVVYKTGAIEVGHKRPFQVGGLVGGRYPNCSIREVINFNRILTATERGWMNAYLARRKAEA